ncbi:MAG: Rpn family recombination-promoting nuclease/putative transposase, partial [Campylobacterota bacterium]|nr:Rpn family recombination-promoting nuclease/putative transposase [Campylobacterota bacterium]
MRFANPRNDIAFKKIFGDETKKEILISFLNAVLDFKDEKEIVDIKIVNPYQVPKIEDLKETILDIKATNREDKHFIVEMQRKDLYDFAKRSLYYTSKAYVEQLDKGEDYETLQKVYFIGICDFRIFESEHYISRHLILNKESMQNDLSDFEFTFIELPKFKKQLSELETVIDKWTYFIKRAEKEEFIPKELNEVQE